MSEKCSRCGHIIPNNDHEAYSCAPTQCYRNVTSDLAKSEQANRDLVDQAQGWGVRIGELEGKLAQAQADLARVEGERDELRKELGGYSVHEWAVLETERDQLRARIGRAMGLVTRNLSCPHSCWNFHRGSCLLCQVIAALEGDG